MKASELRIGNLITDCNFIYTVSEIDENSCWGYINDEKSEMYHLTHFEPIQLTEEWLIKFGFVYDGHTYWSKKINDNTQFSIVENIGKDTGYLVNVGIKLIELDFVHHLQNIYFVLIQEEINN